MNRISAVQLAELINGSIEGDPQVVVSGPSKIDDSQEGTISFLANLKYESFIYNTKASIILVPKDFVAKQDISATLIRVEDVYSSLMLLMNIFADAQGASVAVISSLASIKEGASISSEVSIGDFTIIESGASIGEHSTIAAQVYIGKNVSIGKNVKICTGARILHDCVIGDRCVIQSNAVIGSDGFGYSKDDQGVYTKIQHLGNVILEEDVEIGALTAVDRASIGSTIIRKGVKLDNLIQIAHNVEIGEHTVMAAQAGVAGSGKLGARCMIGGQAAVVGHIQLADGTQVQGQSAVISNTRENERKFGTPAIGYSEYLRSYAVFKNLPDMNKEVSKLKKQIADLESKLS
jgi:UDP-3-O-[3-hydroxymyristoyl] glucosamine N-acyltransferase